MNIYSLPESSEIKNKILKTVKSRIFWGVFFVLVAGIIVGYGLGFGASHYFPSQTKSFLQYLQSPEANLLANNQISAVPYTSSVSYEQAIIDAAKNVSPSVVSIIISKNVPVYEQQLVNPFGDTFPGFDFQIPQQVQKGTELLQVGAGSGFIVSSDGLILTNKHVVSDTTAEYAVFTNDGQKYSAKVLALDPVQDLAVVKIELANKLQPVTLGDSSGIQIGQTAIAIGNALGQFRNTVSVGVVSGLGRTISASDQIGSFSETLDNIIQTDAAINSGNSGGPLLNLKGEVIGINTAMAQGAQGIGFAIPINMAKKDIQQVVATNKITYPFLGVRYILVDTNVKEKYKLSVDYGVLVLKGDKGEVAITADSAAAKAGIKENDVILQVNDQKIDQDNTLSNVIIKYNPGDKVTLKILREGKEINIDVTLGQR